MKKHLYFALILTLTACAAQTSTIPAPTEPTVVIAESSSPTESLIVLTETLAPTATPEATATPEIGEFIPANNIEFTEGLANYDLALAPDADRNAIYWDIIVSHLGDALSKSKGMEANRAVYEQIIRDRPEWDGIGNGWDYKIRVEFMKEFLKRTGGQMIVTDMNFNKFEADFNQDIKFEVINVNELPNEYVGMLATSDGKNRGGGGSMYTTTKGQVVYSVALLPGALERTQTDPAYIYKAWNWTPGEVISNLFRRTITGTIFHNLNAEYGENQPSNYNLYTRGGIPSNENYFSDVYWTFIQSK